MDNMKDRIGCVSRKRKRIVKWKCWKWKDCNRHEERLLWAHLQNQHSWWKNQEIKEIPQTETENNKIVILPLLLIIKTEHRKAVRHNRKV